MSARRLPHLILAALMAMLAALPTVASAAPPEFFVIEIDEFGPAPSLSETCGFNILRGTTGTIKISTRETQDGTIIEIARVHLVVTFVNAETGETLTTPDVGVDKVTIFPDGSAIVAIIGLAQHVVVPGEGRLAGNAGRLVLFFESPEDEEPDVLFESAGLDGSLRSAICSALAP